VQRLALVFVLGEDGILVCLDEFLDQTKLAFQCCSVVVHFVGVECEGKK